MQLLRYVTRELRLILPPLRSLHMYVKVDTAGPSRCSGKSNELLPPFRIFEFSPADYY